MLLASIQETARTLNLSERHCRRMISKGRWPYYRLGPRVIRLDVEEIKNLGRFVAEGKPVEPQTSNKSPGAETKV